MNNTDNTTDNTAIAINESDITVLHIAKADQKAKVLAMLDTSKLGKKVTVITGMDAAVRTKLTTDAAKGRKIMSTWLPNDLASDIGGKYTELRAIDIIRDNGSRHQDCRLTDLFVKKVKDQDALARLAENEDFQKAFGLGEVEEEFLPATDEGL